MSLVVYLPPAAAEPLFGGEERARLVEFWNEPGRVCGGAPQEAGRTGPWVVRLTPESSKWLLAYQRAAGAAKAPPTQDTPNPTSPETEAWEKWVQEKIAYDRWLAQSIADAANGAVRPPAPLLPPGGIDDSSKATEQRIRGVGQTSRGAAAQRDKVAEARANPQSPISNLQSPPPLPPRHPGPIPPALLTAAGDPPPFAEVVAPIRQTVTFEDGDTYHYNDNILQRARYAYYRFPHGTVAYGTLLRDMPADELQGVFAAAGMTPSEQRIAMAVSKLEGGFEAVNTYDTGFVSVGFIQFVTHEHGRGSLGAVLQREKANSSADFERDFRRYGIDVDAGGTLAVVDPGTGAELTGPAAVMRVVEDRRLIAVFQRAGMHTPFRVAQVQTAKSHYWPAEDRLTVTVNGQALAGKVSDVVRSEAGIATLFDRKVNRGTIDPLADTIAKVMTDHGLTRLEDAAAHEREIIAQLKYRADFLADPVLGQPR